MNRIVMAKTIRERLAWLEVTVGEICKDLTGTVSAKEFAPVQRIVYGFIGLVLIAFATAMIGLIIK